MAQGQNPSEEEDQQRVIQIGRLVPQEHALFCDNGVKNSKYTLANFLPRSIFEQFRRLANLYFLGQGFLMLLGTYTAVFETPLTAFSTLFPLAVVLTVSMVQEGMADVKRHKSDDETNNRLAKVTSYKTGAPVTESNVRWRDIRVGDVLYINNKQPLPADMVIFATSEDENICYIETSSIDGETNLKLRRAINYLPPHAAARLNRPEEILSALEKDQGILQCEPPNLKVESFTGTFCIPHKEDAAPKKPHDEEYERVIPIDNENVILRGAVVRNSKWVVGVVVYTGADTKLQRNSRHAPSKMSKIDLLVNRAIYLILLTDVVLVIISTLLLLQFESSYFSGLTYLGYYVPGVTPSWAIAARPDGMQWVTDRSTFIQGFLTFFVLFNNLVPISLYVTLEIMTYTHIFLVNEDLEMYDEHSNTPAKARSNVLTDLGQINFIFSDKTGTLTENDMRFKRASIQGQVYGAPILMTEANATLPYVGIQAMKARGEAGSQVDEFLKVLSLCHTVVIEGADTTPAAGGGELAADQQQQQQQGSGGGAGAVIYQAESPDEKALVEFARDAGYQLVGRTTAAITINIHGALETWTPLAVNKFDSDRKRMSIVLRDPHGKVRLLCKGADTSMLPRGDCSSNDESATLVDHLRVFAQEGLRTLVLAYRDLTQQQYDEWLASYKKAAAAASGRAELMSKVADDLEKEMTIVGITAIEDRLQEGISETIADLAEAGIKLCVLTGDKMETAINIGYSCRVLRQGMLLLQLTSGEVGDIEAGLCRLYKSIIDKKGMAPEFYQQAKQLSARKRSKEISQVWKLMLKHYPNLPTTAAAARMQRQNSLSASTRRYSARQSSSGLGLGGGGGGSVSRDASTAALPIHVRVTQAAASMMMKPPVRMHSRASFQVTEHAFIMEGPALVHVFSDETLQVILFEIMKASSAVIACRVSPKQKAQLVRLVKQEVKPTPVTLAIGDGANDVPMILEAHVGIGVSGKEGQQAVNASDFAIAQFRFLKRLLLVHGRWDYRRCSKVVLYSFYKNIVLVMCLFFYLFSCGFSGPLFEDNVMAGFNFFLGLPILMLGLFDQDMPASYIMDNPKVYVSGRKNMDLNGFQVGKWILSALLDGFLVYFFTVWSLPAVGVTNSEQDYYVLGLAMYAVLILAMNWRVIFEHKTITRPALLPKQDEQEIARGEKRQPRTNCALCGWSLWIWVGSIFGFFVVTCLYGNLLSFSPAFYGVSMQTYSLASVWLQLLLVPIVCLLVEALYLFLADEFFPSPIQLGIEDSRLVLPLATKQEQAPAITAFGVDAADAAAAAAAAAAAVGSSDAVVVHVDELLSLEKAQSQSSAIAAPAN